MAEALDFVKSHTENISKHLTKEHQKLIDRFIAFKVRTEERLSDADQLEKKFVE